MPNWITNVVKIYVPEEYDPLIDQIIAALAKRGIGKTVPRDREAGDEDKADWIDFERLCPTHPALLDGMSEQELSPLVDMVLPWHDQILASVGMGTRPDREGEDSERIADAISEDPRNADRLKAIRRRLAEAGVPYRIDWQKARWGTKWNVGDIYPPRIYPADDHDALFDYHGCTVIDYRFDTAWGAPTGYLRALSKWCEEIGLGIQCWSDIEDTVFNPWTNEAMTQWVEDDELRVEVQQIPLVEQAALLATGIPTEPLHPNLNPVKHLEILS